MRSVISFLFAVVVAGTASAQVLNPEFVVDRDYTYEQLYATREVNDEDDKGTIRIAAHVWRPLKNDRREVVLFNHGSFVGLIRSPKEPTGGVSISLIRFFLSRGYTFVVPRRRGVGESTGTFIEECGFIAGKCPAGGQIPLTERGLSNARLDVNAVVDQVILGRLAPRDGKIILAGQSRGGFLSLILAGERPASVKGVINFAGAWHNLRDGLPPSEFKERVELQAVKLAHAARQTKVPTIWIYAARDPNYSDAAPRLLLDAWRAAGGLAEFVFVAEHSLANPHFVLTAPALWHDKVDQFLNTPTEYRIPVAADGPTAGQSVNQDFVFERDYRFEKLYATRVVDDEYDKGTIRLVTYVWRPVKNDRREVILFSHGSTGGLVRSAKEPTDVLPFSLVAFLVSRGYTVVAPTRRGRGESTGKYVEECAVYAGRCTVAEQVAMTDRGLRNAQADVNAVIDQLIVGRIAPRDGRILLVGHSRGGFLSLVLAGARPTQFAGVVTFAGGWHGLNDRLTASEYKERVATQVVRLAQAAKRAKVPTLWIYAARDPFYNEAAPEHLLQAWRAGGGQAKYVFIKEHSLTNAHLALQNPSLWGGELGDFLRTLESVEAVTHRADPRAIALLHLGGNCPAIRNGQLRIPKRECRNVRRPEAAVSVRL